MSLSRPVFARAFFGVVVSALGVVVGLCVAPANAAERQSAGGWVSMASGTKTVFPGIHGGTAPVSLVPLADGRLMARTGGTEQDFIHLLKGKEKGDPAKTPQLSSQELHPAIIETAREVVLSDGQTVALEPSFSAGAGLWAAPQAQQLSASGERLNQAAQRKRTFAPLKLRPYPVLPGLGGV